MNDGLSMRQACDVAGISRRGCSLQTPPDKNGHLRERLKEIWRPNMGYRMAHALLRHEFAPLNVKRVHRLWKEEKLGRMKRFRKKRTGNQVPLCATRANEVWCLDFCYDSCLNGTKLKVLAVVDEFTRECLSLEVATNFRSINVQRVLSELFANRGAPEYLRSDNGSEFIARSLAVFLLQSGTKSRFIKPGSPWQNGHAESFVSRLRAECLDVEVFHNLAYADLKLTLYKRFYNESRPHSSIGYMPPAKYAHELKLQESLTL
jgi:putative transposase